MVAPSLERNPSGAVVYPHLCFYLGGPLDLRPLPLMEAQGGQEAVIVVHALCLFVWLVVGELVLPRPQEWCPCGDDGLVAHYFAAL